jgi:CPA1 family monovalent cation:H+ antiporter
MILASLILGWGAYLAGEAVHVSGVISTVTAGLVFGWYQHVVFTASVRVRAGAFWQVMVFLMEAMIFILIGLSLRGVLERVGGFETVLSTMTVPVVGVIMAITVARFVWIFGCDAVLALLDKTGFPIDEPLGPRAATVISWAGMRGVVTLAVALTVPEAMPGRDLMLVAAFAAILVTVLLQGTTLGLVIRAAKLPDRGARPALSLAQAEAAVAAAQLLAVRSQAYADDGTLAHPRLLERFERRADQASPSADNAGSFAGDIMAHYDLVLEAVRAGRTELVRLHRAHQISDETLHNLERDLDLEELSATAAKAF